MVYCCCSTKAKDAVLDQGTSNKRCTNRNASEEKVFTKESNTQSISGEANESTVTSTELMSSSIKINLEDNNRNNESMISMTVEDVFNDNVGESTIPNGFVAFRHSHKWDE